MKSDSKYTDDQKAIIHSLSSYVLNNIIIDPKTGKTMSFYTMVDEEKLDFDSRMIDNEVEVDFSEFISASDESFASKPNDNENNLNNSTSKKNTENVSDNSKTINLTISTLENLVIFPKKNNPKKKVVTKPEKKVVTKPEKKVVTNPEKKIAKLNITKAFNLNIKPHFKSLDTKSTSTESQIQQIISLEGQTYIPHLKEFSSKCTLTEKQNLEIKNTHNFQYKPPEKNINHNQTQTYLLEETKNLSVQILENFQYAKQKPNLYSKGTLTGNRIVCSKPTSTENPVMLSQCTSTESPTIFCQGTSTENPTFVSQCTSTENSTIFSQGTSTEKPIVFSQCTSTEISDLSVENLEPIQYIYNKEHETIILSVENLEPIQYICNKEHESIILSVENLEPIQYVSNKEHESMINPIMNESVSFFFNNADTTILRPQEKRQENAYTMTDNSKDYKPTLEHENLQTIFIYEKSKKYCLNILSTNSLGNLVEILPQKKNKNTKKINAKFDYSFSSNFACHSEEGDQSLSMELCKESVFSFLIKNPKKSMISKAIMTTISNNSLNSLMESNKKVPVRSVKIQTNYLGNSLELKKSIKYNPKSVSLQNISLFNVNPITQNIETITEVPELKTNELDNKSLSENIKNLTSERSNCVRSEGNHVRLDKNIGKERSNSYKKSNILKKGVQKMKRGVSRVKNMFKKSKKTKKIKADKEKKVIIKTPEKSPRLRSNHNIPKINIPKEKERIDTEFFDFSISDSERFSTQRDTNQTEGKTYQYTYNTNQIAASSLNIFLLKQYNQNEKNE